jgi:hypothetical protein
LMCFFRRRSLIDELVIEVRERWRIRHIRFGSVGA